MRHEDARGSRPSYALSGDEDKARAAGCDAYVGKPFSPRALLAKIRDYIP
jgi:two-component system cell cycle response regulator DivK